MKSLNEVQQYLNAPIPRSDIWVRDGAGGKKLAYFEAWYVIKTLNDAFGNTGWDSETLEMELIQGTELPTYRAKTRIKGTIRIGDNTHFSISHDGYGIGTGKKVGDHEMALKAAESDSFKRAAMKFGNRTGLGLYDDSEAGIEQKQENKGPTPAAQSSGVRPQGTPAPKATPVAPKEPGHVLKAQTGSASREQVNSLIRSTASVAFAKKVIYQDKPFDLNAMKAMIAGYGVPALENLTDEQAADILGTVQFLVG